MLWLQIATLSGILHDYARINSPLVWYNIFLKSSLNINCDDVGVSILTRFESYIIQ